MSWADTEAVPVSSASLERGSEDAANDNKLKRKSNKSKRKMAKTELLRLRHRTVPCLTAYTSAVFYFSNNICIKSAKGDIKIEININNFTPSRQKPAGGRL